jgi:hypothetical protein
MTRLGRWSVAAASAALVAAVLVAGHGCGDDPPAAPPRSVTQIPEPEDVIDEQLMLAIARAKNLHHKADVYLEDGDVDAAISEVRRILSIPFPAGAPEGQDLLLDARARLAKLLLGKGDLAEATRVVDEGIASSGRESFFLGNLHAVRGEVFHARKQAATDPAEAKALGHQAIEAYDRSDRMHEALQIRLMKQLDQERAP